VGRKLSVISLIGALSILATPSTFGQPGPAHPRRHFFSRPNPQPKNPQPRIQISPEDQQTFRKNAERWLQMTPEERKVMREREQMRRERIRMEADAVLRDSGLRLDEKKRDLFQERYLQERRRIDRELRQEYEAKRQQQLERLKKEFQPPQVSPAATPNTTQAASVTPSR
jgi:hypothetical protein